MLQNFQIVDINTEPQNNLAVQFFYKNYLITATKSDLHEPVVATDEQDREIREGDSIEEVIGKIDLMISQQV